MWNFFINDPSSKRDRKKIQAEKKHMRDREKSWRRRHRKETWRRFKKRFNEFLAHPFSGFRWSISGRRDHLAKTDRLKSQQEKKQVHSREKARRHRRREEAIRRFNKRFNAFLDNPFAKRELTADEREKMRFKMYARRERTLDRQKWWTEFKKNPFTSFKLTEEQRERKQFKIYARRERQHDRQKWWARFKKNPFRTLFPRRQLRMPGGGYHYAFRLSREERKEIASNKRRKFRENLGKVFATHDMRAKFGFAYLHSTAYFILAFMLIYIVYQVITILAASSYNIPIIWSYYKLKFPLYTFSPLYTREALVVIFAMGPIMSLMLAFVFLRLYFTTNVILKRFKLFYLWGFICGANMFFGAYISGFITRTEFIYTSEWLFMNGSFASIEIIFTIIAIAILIIIGRIVTPLFLLSSGSVTMIKPEFRLFFIFSQVILPWFTMMLILFAITLPNYYFPLILKTITPGLIVVPTLFLYNSIQFDNIHESGVIQRTYFRWSIVIVAVAVLFFYRLILGFGLSVS